MRVDAKIQDALRKAISKYKNRNDFANKTDIHQTQLGRYLTGEAKTILDDTWEKLLHNSAFAEAYGLPSVGADPKALLGQSLQNIMKSQGWASAQFGKALGVPEPLAQQWLDGKSLIEVDSLRQLRVKGVVTEKELGRLTQLRAHALSGTPASPNLVVSPVSPRDSHAAPWDADLTELGAMGRDGLKKHREIRAKEDELFESGNDAEAKERLEAELVKDRKQRSHMIAAQWEKNNAVAMASQLQWLVIEKILTIPDDKLPPVLSAILGVAEPQIPYEVEDDRKVAEPKGDYR